MLLFTFVTLAFLLSLDLLVFLFFFVRVIDERLKLSVDVGKAVSEALVGDNIATTDWTVLLLLSNYGVVHFTRRVVVRIWSFVGVLDDSVVFLVCAIDLDILDSLFHIFSFELKLLLLLG